MLLDILMLLGGLALLVVGGNWVTDGGTALARRLNMSTLMVGLTVVALGSSAPDLVISLVATLKGHPQMAVGDVVGANIFDFLLVMGVMALIKPIKISQSTFTGDLPVAALSAWLLFFCAADIFIDGASVNSIDRSDGLIMLTALGMFMVYTVMAARQTQSLQPERVQAQTQASAPATDTPGREMPWWLALVVIAAGLAGLIFGAQWFVDGASAIAYKAGWSEGLVGLTIVAIGSSLPDMAASVMATLKKQAALAMGNLLGSCIFNVLLVLGTCSVVAPLPAGSVSLTDFISLVGAATAVWLFAALGRRDSDGSRTIGRVGGGVLAAGYVAYIVWLIVHNVR